MVWRLKSYPISENEMGYDFFVNQFLDNFHFPRPLGEYEGERENLRFMVY